MLLTTSVLKSGKVPNKCPQYKYLLLTFTTTTFVFLGDEPDMNYEATADIIGNGYGTQIKIPKHLCRNNEIHFYQTSGANSYVGLTEVSV